jgi:integrase
MQAGDILAAYEPYLAAGRARRYAITCLAHLRELRDFAKKPLEAITAADAEAFLTHILMTPGQQRKANGRRTAGTRNRALAACSGFYKWGVRIGRLPQNPFAGQHSIREPQLPEIIYLSREERGGVLEEAQLLPDGVAAWLALYAGLRRSEIIRAAWSDVLWDTARLVVPRAKTGERRVVPLQTTLLTRLRELRPAAGKGPVVPWPENMAKAEARAEHLLDRLRKACAGVPARRISWNSFRHSFASALAQAGVSLDKISAWMGNSPAVCRRHYAEFVPRDARDAEIDLL